MRPLYESADDCDSQSQVIAVYGELMNCTSVETMTTAPYDFRLYKNGRIFEIGEVKCRNVGREAYQTYMLAWKKYKKLISLNSPSVSVSLVVRFQNGIYRCYLPPATCLTGFGGRKDRRDSLDEERVVYIPLSLFGKLL